MNKVTTLACMAALASLALPAQAQTISIVSTPSGSYTNSAGAAMAKVISEQSRMRAILQAQSQQGMIPVEAGNAEFGMGNSFDMTFYVNGTGEYEGQGVKPKIRIAASLIPYRVAFHVRANSDIKIIADLKGKRIAGGFNAQKTIARITEALLATAGLTYRDMSEVLAPNVSRAAEDFTAGKTDVLFFALGSAAVKQAAATLGGVRVLPTNNSADAVKRMQDVLPAPMWWTLLLRRRSTASASPPRCWPSTWSCAPAPRCRSAWSTRWSRCCTRTSLRFPPRSGRSTCWYPSACRSRSRTWNFIPAR